ncbi:MAG: trans-sulfuration enzyme family protein [Acidimicrobiia bacterium]
MAGEATRAVHGDRSLDDLSDVAPPIRPSTTFRDGEGRRYRRTSHATTERLEAVLGSLEGGHAAVYASGMAAVAAALDHVHPRQIALPADCYHGVRELANRKVEQGDLALVEPSELGEGDLLWVETPSNPMCLITDLEQVTTEAHGRGALVVCDSTFATPILQKPLEFGVDLVMHSATKGISGHSDAVVGVLVSGSEAVGSDLRSARQLTGAVPGSLDSWLSLRGVRTLPLRINQATRTAGSIAGLTHSSGVQTYYPGIPNHPGHDIARRQMSGFGAMMSVDVESQVAAERFIEGLSLFVSATSLGGVESLAEHRMRSDSTVAPGLVRLSIGIEDEDDLVADVGRALDAIS